MIPTHELPYVSTKRFARLARDPGLPPITLHGVRHSYATAALAAGEPLKVVSERLGHASTSITANLYQHVLPSMDERTANAVARLILGGKPDAESSAINPLSTGPQVHEAQEGGDARTGSSGGVSEGGAQPYAYRSSYTATWRSPLVGRMSPALYLWVRKRRSRSSPVLVQDDDGQPGGRAARRRGTTGRTLGLRGGSGDPGGLARPAPP